MGIRIIQYGNLDKTDLQVASEGKFNTMTKKPKLEEKKRSLLSKLEEKKRLLFSRFLSRRKALWYSFFFLPYWTWFIMAFFPVFWIFRRLGYYWGQPPRQCLRHQWLILGRLSWFRPLLHKIWHRVIIWSRLRMYGSLLPYSFYQTSKLKWSYANLQAFT